MKNLLLLLAFIGTTFNYFAATHIVTNTLNTGAGSLRNTIAAASADDTIRFDPNLIASGSNTIFLTTEIAFSKSLTIIGLYNATDTLFISGNNTSRILSISHVNYTILDSLVLINGNGRGVSGSGRGGAINFYNTDSLFVYNSVIKNNTSSFGGGAIYASSVYTSTVFIEITNSSVLSNTSSSKGGGIFFEDPNGSIPSTLVLNNSTISENSASSGGGICMINSWNQPVSLILNNSTVSKNSASSSGGGIYVYDTDPLSTVTLNNSIVSGNSAKNGGGIYTFCFGASTEVNLNHSTIYGNSASNDGGGVFSFTSYASSSSSSVTVKNSTISGNSANNGGGIYSKADGVISSFPSSSLVILTNSTLTGNSASTNGGGIYSISSNISTITSKSSIIALNGNNNIYNSNTVNTITSQGYNILSETSITGSVPTDQLGVTAVQLNLGPLQNNGGTTGTMLPSCKSVAIDKGTPSDASAAQNKAITDSRRDVGAAEYLNPTTVNFTGSPLFGCAPLTTNFVDASSGSVAIASWAWDFGDGNTSSVKNPTHVYQTPGIYSISLEVTDVNGCRTKFTRTNYLQVIGPDVDFGALQITDCLGSAINFKDSTILVHQ